MKDRSYEQLEKVGTITKYHFQCQKNNTMTLNDNYQPLHKSYIRVKCFKKELVYSQPCL